MESLDRLQEDIDKEDVNKQDPAAILLPEVFMQIALSLGMKDLVAASGVNKIWKKLCISPVLWKRIYFSKWMQDDILNNTEESINWYEKTKKRYNIFNFKIYLKELDLFMRKFL
jgi:hypothetical protein